MLSVLCRPPNASAIASHRPGFPTGCFTICFFRISMSSSLHSLSSTTGATLFPSPLRFSDAPLFETAGAGTKTVATSSDLRGIEDRGWWCCQSHRSGSYGQTPLEAILMG